MPDSLQPEPQSAPPVVKTAPPVVKTTQALRFLRHKVPTLQQTLSEATQPKTFRSNLKTQNPNFIKCKSYLPVRMYFLMGKYYFSWIVM